MEKETKKKKTNITKDTKNVKKTTTKKVSTSNKNNVKKSEVVSKEEKVKKDDVLKTEESKKNNTTKKENIKKDDKKNVVAETKEDNFFTDNSEITNLVKIVIAVTAVFLIFYLITWIITKNNNKVTNNENTEVSFKYDNILMSNLLNQQPNSYYVFAFHQDDLYINAYDALVSMYQRKENSLRVYYSNLSLKFNEKYYDKELETSNLSNINELKLNKTVLFKITNKQIEQTFEGEDAIINYLTSISK